MEMNAAAIADELLQLVTEECLGVALFGEERYQSLGIGASSAGRAAALQEVAGGRGARLAGAECLQGALLPAVGLACVLPADRSRALAGNVLRLRRHSELACQVMSMSNLLPPGRSGEYLRALALVHWERAWSAEAVALLERAERLFRDSGQAAEALATRRLRVLLHAELGGDGEALVLYEATGPATVDDRPWLGARAALAAAFCLAARGEAGDGKTALHARTQGRKLALEVTEEAERLYLQWLAARAEARRPGGRREAEAVLAGLREPALRLWPVGDVILLLLDLQVCRTPGRERLDLAVVEEDLRSVAPSADELAATRKAFGMIRHLAGSLSAWGMAELAGRTVRNVFRLFHPAGLRPLPFRVPWPTKAVELSQMEAQ